MNHSVAGDYSSTVKDEEHYTYYGHRLILTAPNCCLLTLILEGIRGSESKSRPKNNSD